MQLDYEPDEPSDRSPLVLYLIVTAVAVTLLFTIVAVAWHQSASPPSPANKVNSMMRQGNLQPATDN